MIYFTGEWYSDSAIMTGFLEEVEFYSGTERKKMLNVSKKIGGSMLYGTTWRSYLTKTRTRTKCEETGLYKTKVYDEHPELKGIFKEFATLHFPNFKYEQVQMNKNFTCPPHKDSKNIGESVLCCFGDYTGGDTCIDFESKTRTYNSRLGPVRFDGSKYLHWVKPFEGTRYSLVFFTNSKK